MPCSGIRIAYNVFEDNFGCYQYGGSLVSIHCTADVVSTPQGTIDDDKTQEMNRLVTYPEIKDDFFLFDYDGYLKSNQSEIVEV